METAARLKVAIPPPFPLSNTATAAVKQHLRRAPIVSCLRSNDDFDGSPGARSQIKLESRENSASLQINLQSSNVGAEHNNDIWKLFTEAQQNILHLNKQRLTAFKELEKIKGEKQLLLNKIEQLESERLANHAKDKASVCWEWLLQIDSMVLRNLITTAEASELRQLVVDSRVSITDIASGVESKNDPECLSDLRSLYAIRKKNGLHIVHICTEMEPLVSVGSLASYVTGLSCALQEKGNIVEVILPKYARMELGEVQSLKETEAEFYSYFNGQYHGNRIWTGIVRGIGVTFIQPVNYSSFFSRESVYGHADDFERFSYFSRASLDYIIKSGKHPDVLHIHNWETAIVGPLFWDVFSKQGLEGTRIMLTCHNFDSWSHEKPEKLALCGLDPSRLHRPDRLQHNNIMELVDILKGGIVYSNKVAVTCPIDLKSKNSGTGIEATLLIHKEKLLIAPCGFNDSLWDPSNDKFLPQTYTSDDLEGKAVCKITLQQRLGLSENVSTPTIGCIVSDLSDHDIKNLQAAVWIASKRGFQLIVMANNKAPDASRAFESLREYKDANVRFVDKYDEAFSHLVLAGSDIVLCSSFEDPLLQVPLKAIKYGAAPITITFSPSISRNLPDDLGNTKFSQFINTTFANMSLNQALDELQHNPLQWNRMIIEGMRKDFSWNGESCDIHISAYSSLKNL